jgi:hypothetical protein
MHCDLSVHAISKSSAKHPTEKLLLSERRACRGLSICFRQEIISKIH